MKNRFIIQVTVVAALVAAACTVAQAQNIDLTTVPPRDTVQLTIYNSEDITLVRETRSLSLKKGVNRIQYSWANTLIDPTSVEIRPLDKTAEVEVLDTTYPADRPQQLVWNIDSKTEGQARFEVTYFTSGITWAADYVLVSDPEEKTMQFDGFVEITNNSGEDYENASVRLVVGVINLVEKISDLARRGVVPMSAVEEAKNGVAGRAMKQMVLGAAVMDFDADERVAKPQIIKEGLSEYFIYTVEGEQTVPNSWSKRLSSFSARDVEFDMLYRLRPHQYGPRPVRFFIVTNDEEHNLGTTPLPDGLVRVFRDNGRDGLSFLCEQSVKYVPIKEEIELMVGTDDEVVHERKVMSAKRTNFAFNRHQQVEGWDETRTVREEVRNYRPKPLKMEIRHIIEGDVEIETETGKAYDYRTVEFTVEVKANAKYAWEYSYTEHIGKNAKQATMRMR